MPEINLLPEEERKEVAVKKRRRRLTIYSVVAVIIAALISVGVFTFWAQLLRQEKQLTETITNLEKQIESLVDVERYARILKNKLTAILTISEQAVNFERILLDVAQIIPSGVQLSDLTVSEQNQIKFSGTAISASEFSNLVLTLVRSDVGRANFDNVSVESITRDEKGGYKFAISAKLKAL